MNAPESVTIRLPKGALAGWPVLIHALRMAEKQTSLHLVFGGLIEQIEAQTKPPKPVEPAGLGAVVEDANGRLWIRTQDPDDPWSSYKTRDEDDYERYADLDVVRVLSEGVTL